MSYIEVVILCMGGSIAGLVNGTLGIGCGVCIVPILVTMGLDPLSAVATSHLAAFMSSSIASAIYWRDPNFSVPKILVIGIPAVLTAQFGGQIAASLPHQAIFFGFAGAMFIGLDVMGAAQRRKGELLKENAEARPLESVFFSYMIIGLITGCVASIFGLGGGLIVVPLLLLMTEEAPKSAVKISLGAMTIISGASLVPHLLAGTLSLGLGGMLGICTTVGTLLGSGLLPHVPNWVIRQSINVCLLLAGIHMFIAGVIV